MTASQTISRITVRRSRFDPQQGVSRHYFAGQSPLMSHLLTALSMTFPAGEQFFVHSVRNVRDRVSDESLQAAISAFIGQEAMHSQAHARFNQALSCPDYDLQAYEQKMAQGLTTLKSRSPRRQLAATVAYEHFTAMIAAHLLSQPQLFDGFDDNLRQLWLWHALEELEHKSVAFDVYQQVFDGQRADTLAQRRRSMRTVSMGFVMGIAGMTTTLFWQDRKYSLGSVRNLALTVRDSFLIGRMVLALMPDYLAYYRAGFHPQQTDHQALIDKWRRQLELA
jgi:hypothetical protein